MTEIIITYSLICYAIMGLYLAMSKGRAVNSIAARRNIPRIFIANVLFFLSPLIFLRIILEIIKLFIGIILSLLINPK